MKRWVKVRSVWIAALLPLLAAHPAPRAGDAACPPDDAAAPFSNSIREALGEGMPQEDLKQKIASIPFILPRSCSSDVLCRLRLDLAEAKLRLLDGDGALNALDEAITACGAQASMTALRRAGAVLIAKNEDLRAVNYYLRFVQKAEAPGTRPAPPAEQVTEVHKEIVRALHRLGEDDRAFHEAEHPALSGWPEEADADALYLLADIARETRHWDKAAAALERLVNVYPTDPRRPEALVGLAVARVNLGQGAAARFLFNEVIRQSPDTDAAVESKLALLDLPQAEPLSPKAIRETLKEVATHALDSRLAARAVTRFLAMESKERGLAAALFTLVEWSRGAAPLSRDAVFRSLQPISPAVFSADAPERGSLLAAAHSLDATFGAGVLPFTLAAAAAREAYDLGLFELAARLSGTTQDAETPAEAEEIRGLHLRALLAASRFEEAAAAGGKYLDEGSGARVALETCRALRALGKWEEIEKRVDAGPAPSDVASQALLELWRGEAVWNLGDPRAAAESALLFAGAQVKRLPLVGTEARGTLADLALLAGDGFYGAGEIEKSTKAYLLAKSLAGGSWREERAEAGRALLEKEAPSARVPENGENGGGR